MTGISYYESRPGRVACTAEEVFNFVTDIRNFEQFIPQGTITNWLAEKEFCSFDVTMLGKVKLLLIEKTMYTRAGYSGDAMKKNDFSLILNISDIGYGTAEVKVSLNVDLNPMLKILASEPIQQFLEKLINEMEHFKGWKNTIE